MHSTTVSKLKMSISAYIRQVKTGEELLITEHGRPVARLVPVTEHVSLPGHIKEMEKNGLLKRAEKSLPADFWNLPRPVDAKAEVRSAVMLEREEGR